MESKRFKIVIVGGSIAGLTLAHCLDKLGVDYVVLEKRKEIAPQEGASVGIMPHGGRILDQLGMFEAIEQYVEPLHTACISFPDGFTHVNPSPRVLFERFGLPLAFLERRKLLQVLYDFLPDKSRVLVDKTVVSVEQDGDSSAAVRVQDGSIYRGDLVVGADGVHSRIRKEMWRLADLERPRGITEREKNGMSVEYACIFGISDAVPNLEPGEQVASLNNGRSFLTFPSKDGRVFWFLMNKLDRRYSYSTAPRLSSADAERIAESFAADQIWNGLQFGELWKRRQVFGATNLEENVFQTWHWGRVVCIGDSMHKMAPNTGQGANCAIEDAAVLANLLHKTLKDRKVEDRPSNQEIHSVLQHLTQIRIPRVQEIFNTAKMVIRLHARRTLLLRFVGRYYLPRAGDIAVKKASQVIGRGVQLDFLPPSQRSGPGWETFGGGEKGTATYIPVVSVLALVVAFVVWMRSV